MPELPEVETIVRSLRSQIIGTTILSASLLWEKTLAAPSPEAFSKLLIGQSISEITRRGKYIHIHLTATHLFIHLRMSGDLIVKSTPYTSEKHDRLLLHLNNSKLLVFNDTRKFGRVWLTKQPEDVIGDLGPEPLDKDFSTKKLFAALHSKHRAIKPLLLDQSFIAGLGNIYTDEALHISGIHPLRNSALITIVETEKLFSAIRKVLLDGIEHNGASIDWVYRGGDFQNYFRVYGRENEACLTCGTKISKIIVGQRGTHFCQQCQEDLL